MSDQYTPTDDRSTGNVITEAIFNELTTNFRVLNSIFRQELPIAGGIAPLSGIAAASLSLVESSGAGTAKPVIYMLSFDDSTDEGRMWTFRMPRGYGVTAKLVGSYKMAGANVDKDAVLICQVSGVSATDADQDAKVFDSTNSTTERVPALAETAGEFSITLTNFDSIAADDWVCLVLYLDESASNHAGDFQLTSLAVDFDLAT